MKAKAVTSKDVAATFLILVASMQTLGQTPATKYVMLSPKSNLDTATVSEGFAKSCPNLIVTENEAKANFILEASSKMTFSEGDSFSHWHFTLLNRDGDVLMTTHPERHFTHRFKHHFESICKYVNGK